MCHASKSLLEICFDGLQAFALVFTAIYTYIRFLREDPLRPRIQFDVECEFWGPQDGAYLASLTIHAENKGNVEHRFETISLKVSGIEKNEQLTGDHFDGQIVEFPRAIVEIKNLVPITDEYYFVRPGINQAFNYALNIPGDIKFIKINAQFTYEKGGDPHYAQKIYEVKEDKS